MRNLLKVLLMGAMVVSLASCGKKNESSGGSSSNSNNGGVITSGTNFGSFDQIRSTFTNMDAASGLNGNDVVYHMGPDYGAQQQSFDFEVGFDYCIDLIIWESGNCENYQMPVNGQLDNILANGEYKVVKGASRDVVDYDLAVDANNGLFVFEPRQYNRGTDMYKLMLNLDNKPTRNVIVTPAEVRLTDGQVVKADYVEYFYTDGTVEGFVLSTGFPLMANPLYNTVNYNTTGVLSFAGPRTIKSISVMTHYLEYDARTNTYQARDGGRSQVTF